MKKDKNKDRFSDNVFKITPPKKKDNKRKDHKK